MALTRDVSSGWKTYEVCESDAEGAYVITPFSDSLAAPGAIPAQVIIKIRMVQEIGWPEAKRRIKDNKGRPLIVKKDEIIWLLKCKPSCWRLYFYVSKNEPEGRIIYVHAICKQTDKEDPTDAARARRVADGIRPGGSRITLFEFSPG